MMPPILTCLLGKRLCEDPATDDHWTLRRLAATMVAYVCGTFGHAYDVLVPRVLKTMTKTLGDVDKPLPSHYGAVVGLMALGVQTVEAAILPNVRAYMDVLRPVQVAEASPLRVLEAGKCSEALLEAVRLWQSENVGEKEWHHAMLREVFGRDL